MNRMDLDNATVKKLRAIDSRSIAHSTGGCMCQDKGSLQPECRKLLEGDIEYLLQLIDNDYNFSGTMGTATPVSIDGEAVPPTEPEQIEIEMIAVKKTDVMELQRFFEWLAVHGAYSDYKAGQFSIIDWVCQFFGLENPGYRAAEMMCQRAVEIREEAVSG